MKKTMTALMIFGAACAFGAEYTAKPGDDLAALQNRIRADRKAGTV